MVIDKPAGLVVHPAPGHEDGTLVNALLAHCDDLRGIGGELRPGIVHRIDKDTSGLLVVAKDDQTMNALGAAFKAHDIERVYEALVVGKPPAESGRIDTLHGRDPRDRKKFSIRVQARAARGHRLARRRTLHGRRAHGGASWRPGARTRCACTWRRWGVRCWRIATYGEPPRDPALRAIAEELGRQALHARTLGFVHPATGKTLSFTSEPPEDFRRALAALRAREARDDRGVVRRRGASAAAGAVGADPGAVSPRVHHAAGRRQRAAVRHAEPGHEVGRRARAA